MNVFRNKKKVGVQKRGKVIQRKKTGISRACKRWTIREERRAAIGAESRGDARGASKWNRGIMWGKWGENQN